MPNVNIRDYGDPVIVLDHRGRILDRGKIIGRSRGREIHYDVMTGDGIRLPAIPESRLRDAVMEAI